ncbi:MAG TPA: YbjN domain-containing protein [Paracoccaceae bacterium]|nr:YbjN domain-containing protein [Paracoccaceae bacterium]
MQHAVEHDLSTDDLHPIDLVETLAHRRDWEFDRVDEDQIAMAVEGAWRTYTLSLAWSAHDDMLKLVGTFDMNPPARRRNELYKLLDKANDQLWGGAFTLWPEHKLTVYRYGLVLAGGGSATGGQVEAMLHNAVEACERFYPAFQLVCWGGAKADAALEIAITGAYGRA